VKLIKPSISFQESYNAYIEELGDESRHPFPMDFDHRDFAAMLAKIEQYEQGIDLPAGYEPSTTYWLVDGDELIGAANLRHQLSDILKQAGGHIGLGIRPKYRGQGLSVKLLNLTLAKAHNMGINPVEVHCYQDNLPSAGMIKACGGVFHSSHLMDNGKTIDRYVIKL